MTESWCHLLQLPAWTWMYIYITYLLDIHAREWVSPASVSCMNIYITYLLGIHAREWLSPASVTCMYLYIIYLLGIHARERVSPASVTCMYLYIIYLLSIHVREWVSPATVICMYLNVSLKYLFIRYPCQRVDFTCLSYMDAERASREWCWTPWSYWKPWLVRLLNS